MVAHCLDGYPLEACGLLGGTVDEPDTGRVDACYPVDNVAASARVYEVDPAGCSGPTGRPRRPGGS